MVGCRLVLFTAAISCLALQHTVHGGCPGRGKKLGRHHPIFDACFGHYCPRFQLAECREVDCEPRFFVGETDVTDHCSIDYCEIHGIECNGLCDIHPISGPYCNPSCDIDDGGCSEDEVCVPRRIFCITSPCPQPIECVPKSVLCNLPPSTDSCGLEVKRFFYNASSQSCELFVHGGCDNEGTENRFTSLRECQETCSGVTDLCAIVRCPAGTRCQVDHNSGSPYCQPSCEYENGGCSEDEVCRLTSVFCITTPCPEVVNCFPREELCSQQPDAGDCQQQNPAYFFNNVTGKCDKFYYSGCGGNDNRFYHLDDCRNSCEIPLGGGEEENPCSLIDCAPGRICQVNEFTGQGECVFDNRCLLANCPPGTFCRINDLTGQAECISSPHPCALILCHESQICRIDLETQSGYCGVNPCVFIDCGPQSVCRYIPEIDDSVCVPNPCFGFHCENGTFCQANDSGIAKCVSEKELCSQLHCAPGSHCEVAEGSNRPVCVDDPHPCDDVHCWFFQICRVNPVTQTGYCGFNPCFFTFCAFGYHCKFDETTDSAVCLPPVEDPCISTLCILGTQCQVNEETGAPECVADPCALLRCQAGFQCQMNQSGNAECVALL